MTAPTFDLTYRRTEDGPGRLCSTCMVRSTSYVTETFTFSTEVLVFNYCDEHPPAGWLVETSECPGCGSDVREREEHECALVAGVDHEAGRRPYDDGDLRHGSQERSL